MEDPQALPAPGRSGTKFNNEFIDAPATADEEAVLGWECANPALQIERWRQETAPAGPSC